MPTRDFRVNAGLHLRRHEVSRQSGRQSQPGAPLNQALRLPAGPARCRTRRRSSATDLGRLDAGHRRQRPVGAVLCRWPPDRATTTPAPTCSRRRRRTASRSVNARVGMRGPRRALGDRVLGPEHLQQGLCPGRVQLAVPGGRDRRVPGSAVSGRPPALLAVPRRAADLWRDAARQVLSEPQQLPDQAAASAARRP